MLLLYRQIELARAKAVVKLADIIKEYDEATMGVYHEACDASAMTNEISAAFDKRTRLENFCKNIDILQAEIDGLTRTPTISREKLLHVIRNCKGIHLNAGLSGFYLDGKWFEFESYTPYRSECPVLTDAGLALLNEWENRLDESHQRLHLEGHAFSLEEFFRHLCPGKNHGAYALDSELPDENMASKVEDEDEDDAPQDLSNYRGSRFLPGIKREWVRGGAIFMALVFVLAVIYASNTGERPEDSYRYKQTIVAEEEPGSFESLKGMLWKSEERKNVELEQEVISLKQQVYVLQQASAKHDNFLQNLGMER